MRILFVDDDPDERVLASRAVAQEFPEASILQAFDRDSLEAALGGGTLDLLVTDYDLRWMTGFGIFDIAKSISPTCLAIMYTGTGNEELAVRAMKHGFDDYVVKSATQRRRLAASTRAALTRRDERRALEHSRALVLEELYHRLHNNLQIVISLIRQTERDLGDAATRQSLADLRQRIQALAALQEHLYRSGDFRSVDFSGALGDLARHLVETAASPIRLSLDLSPADLPVDIAVPLTLIVNEFLTSFLKQDPPRRSDSRLSLTLAHLKSALQVVIHGEGLDLHPVAPALSGTVSRRVVDGLAAQVGATINTKRFETGFECRISIPR